MFHTRTMRTAVLASAFALSTGAFAANVSTDYNHETNFRSYHTFSFFKVQTADPFLDKRLEAEVTQDLGKAGYTMVSSGGDLNVTLFEGEHNRKEYNTFYDGLGGFGYGWRGWGGWGGGWGPSYQNTTVENVPVGTLMLDMYDGNTHQLVWRGRAMTDIGNNADKNTKKFDKDVDHMLNGFPPRAQG